MLSSNLWHELVWQAEDGDVRVLAGVGGAGIGDDVLGQGHVRQVLGVLVLLVDEVCQVDLLAGNGSLLKNSRTAIKLIAYLGHHPPAPGRSTS